MSTFADGLAIVRADDVAPQPWKNGGGVTRELLRLPLPGGAACDWLLRISLADIEADGPFSPFAGITRWFAVIAGAGVRLRWPGAGVDRVVTPGDAPLCFDGADAPSCALVEGATRDLNVMVRSNRANVELAAASFDDGEQSLGRSTGFGIFVLAPLLLHGPAPEPLSVPARTLVWCNAGASEKRSWWLEEPDDAIAGLRETSASGEAGSRMPCAYWIRLVQRVEPPRA